MADAAEIAARLAHLEADNARLRWLLDADGTIESLRHSLRDTLAMLRAIVRQSAENAADVESYVAHLEGRLDAITRVRVVTDAFGEADLHAIVSDELLVHLVRESEQATIEGPPIRLEPKAAQVFALAMHELASNAVQHGSLARSDSGLDVAWHVGAAEAGPLVFVWKEHGGSCKPDPARRGFGTLVLEETLAYELGAQTTLVFQPDGLCCTIRFPLTNAIGRHVEDENGRGLL